MPDPPIRVELTAQPGQVTASTLSSLTIGGVVINIGTVPVDIESHTSQLLVDRKPALSWVLAIGNGTRDEREHALPPGEQVEFRRVMGASLFSAVGDHELVLVVRGVRSAPVIVRLNEPAEAP